MTLTAGEIQRVHASFGAPDELVNRRRAVYRLALNFAASAPADGQETQDPVSSDILDNPVVRAHLAEVLGGTADLSTDRLRPMSQLVAADGEARGTGDPVRLASTPMAVSVLTGALRYVDRALGPSALTGSALVLAGSPAFDRVMRTLTDGVALATAVAPELAHDLLPHVALFAVVVAEAAGRLGSASVRQFPGLILLPEPRTPLEVAEALVHEGAHQKFFDLAITRSMLGDPPADGFTPPWAAHPAPVWPFEQAVAAFHAYSCLAAFAASLRGRPGVELHPESLLPVAAERAGLLGDWLSQCGRNLGADGRALVGGLAGTNYENHVDGEGDPNGALVGLLESAGPIALEKCGDWTLVMKLVRPAVIVWAPTSAVDRFVRPGS